ncbi:MAG: GNAT family N-acetyltransferase [Opitutus sp.]|nr:GNAT family N-acetyltransferase [Opitutus sp.]MCS6246846.1 GNAT family N-acetyltransferase [Opitutus sp.]MCS6273431.1 GNAT family N-acetyltransferase [Opitutus sp.]MCS6275776.1 GNAT family N-acetyltransferase [Opitutus sp.]MCS6300872.1 GNAT family N-acetyltransferase [Opitutus sp.]
MTPVPLQARSATLAEAGVLLDLMRDFYAEEHLVFNEPVAQRALAELLAQPDLGSIQLFESTGSVIGYAVITFGFSLEFRGRLALLDEFYLVPAQRGHGFGRNGLELIKAWVRTTTVATLRLEVSRTNARARSLYQNNGFRDEQRDLLTHWL